MLRLHEDELCGDSYKVRLLLALLHLDYERVRVERYPARQNATPAFRAMSPLGALPVLEDDGIVVHDAHAILVYLARRYGPPHGPSWLPDDTPRRLADVQRWLGFAARLSECVFARRTALLHDLAAPPAAGAPEATPLLRLLDETCWFNARQGTPFVCATLQPGIADIACFAPVALLDEAGIESLDYPALAKWAMRIRHLDGFATMAGVYAAY